MHIPECWETKKVIANWTRPSRAVAEWLPRLRSEVIPLNREAAALLRSARIGSIAGSTHPDSIDAMANRLRVRAALSRHVLDTTLRRDTLAPVIRVDC